LRITKKVFSDLAIFMVLLGIGVGLVFPFFCLALGVPAEVALKPVYFAACIAAGIALAVLNITLARKTVGSRIRTVSAKMKHVEAILTDRENGNEDQDCDPGECLIVVDSEDELGESADSFNKLVMALSRVLDSNSELRLFSETLTSHLDLDTLSREALDQLIKNTGAIGGAILSEKGGELIVEAAEAIRDPLSLVKNERLLRTINTQQPQLIRYPTDMVVNGIVVDFRPCELIVEPIVYKNSLLGVMLLVSAVPFPEQTTLKLKLFNQVLCLAFRNALTHEQMTRLAAVDPLTGSYNRRFGTLRAHEEFSRAIRAGTPLSVFDIDHFKVVNDTYGHPVGDKVLMAVAKIVLGSIREGDILARYGGEEFLCILPGASQHDANIVAERIRIMVMDSHVMNFEQEIRVTISVGAATYPNGSISNSDQLIKLADEAMYAAKNTGRNRIVSY
jgi:two-component system cell cycle response regulator